MGEVTTRKVHTPEFKAKGHDFGSQMDAPQVVRFMLLIRGAIRPFRWRRNEATGLAAQ